MEENEEEVIEKGEEDIIEKTELMGATVEEDGRTEVRYNIHRDIIINWFQIDHDNEVKEDEEEEETKEESNEKEKIKEEEVRWSILYSQ